MEESTFNHRCLLLFLLHLISMNSVVAGAGVWLPLVRFSKQLQNHVINIKHGLSVLDCIDECRARPRCESLSYHKASLGCQLNAAEGPYFPQHQGFLHIQKADWEQDMRDYCTSQEVPLNAKCREEAGDWSVEECEAPPVVERATMFGNRVGTGMKLKYACVDYGNTFVSTCGEDGTWGDVLACPKYGSCKEIKAAMPSALSREYTVYIDALTTPVSVYCEFDVDHGYTYIPKSTLSNLKSLSDFLEKTDHVKARIRSTNNAQFAVRIEQHSGYRQFPLSLQLNDNAGYTKPKNSNHEPYIFVGFLPAQLASNRGIWQGYRAGGKDNNFRNCDGNPNSYLALIAGRPVVPGTCCTNAFMRGWIDDAHPVPSSSYLPADTDDYFYFFEMHFGGCGGYFTSEGSHNTLGVAVGLSFSLPV